MSWRVGDRASVRQHLTDEAVRGFAAATGDANPLHLDDDFAAATRFGRRIGHGMWAGALISSVLGTRLPGAGTIYLSQSLRFTAPVFIGDVVEASVEVLEIDADRGLATLATVCQKQDGTVVVTGEAKVLMPETVPEGGT